MLQIVLLIYGIIGLFRIPKLLRMTPAEFPNAPLQVFEDWRKKELWSIYIVLIAGWGVLVLVVLLLLALILSGAVTTNSLEAQSAAINGISLILLLVGAIWSSSLTNQAKKLKAQMMSSAPANSYYPRPGAQATLSGNAPPVQNPDLPLPPPPSG
jgi:hypothetical protein